MNDLNSHVMALGALTAGYIALTLHPRGPDLEVSTITPTECCMSCYDVVLRERTKKETNLVREARASRARAEKRAAKNASRK